MHVVPQITLYLNATLSIELLLLVVLLQVFGKMMHELKDDQLHTSASEALPSGCTGTDVLLDEQSNYVLVHRFTSSEPYFVLQLHGPYVVELKLFVFVLLSI